MSNTNKAGEISQKQTDHRIIRMHGRPKEWLTAPMTPQWCKPVRGLDDQHD